MDLARAALGAGAHVAEPLGGGGAVRGQGVGHHAALRRAQHRHRLLARAGLADEARHLPLRVLRDVDVLTRARRLLHGHVDQLQRGLGGLSAPRVCRGRRAILKPGVTY